MEDGLAGPRLGAAAEARARPGMTLRPFAPFSGAAEADEGGGDWSFIDCEMEEVDLQDLPSATIACHLDPRVFVDGLCRNGSVTVLAERWQIWNFTVEVRIATATSFSKWYFRPLERLSLWEKTDLGRHPGYSKGNRVDPCHLGVLAMLLLFSLADLATQGQSCTCRASGGRPSEIHLDSVFRSSWGQFGWPGLPCGPPGSSRNHSRVISGPQHLA
ncbi:calcipressin-1 isoform 2-T2 [Megaptera novaeangliae]